MAAKKPDKDTSVSQATGKWHSISIVCKGNSCEAARRRATERFLSHRPPKLPLEDCDRPGTCGCVYRHHADRRDDPRRASDDGGPPPPIEPVNDRRQRRGRRNNDR